METHPKDQDILKSSQSKPNALDAARMPLAVSDALVHPDAAPLQEVPRDDGLEATLSRVENLIGKGHYGAALREIGAVKIGGTEQAGEYAFILQDKTARAGIGIADRYFIRGDAAGARRFYRQAIDAVTADPAVKGIAEAAGQAFDSLLQRRKALIDSLQESIRTGRFDQWCGKKRDLTDFTVLDVSGIREQVVPDYDLERIFGEHPPIVPLPGYINPVPPETDFIDFPSTVPGAVFNRRSDRWAGQDASVADTRLKASVAMPIVTAVMQAKLGLFALDAGLDVSGQARGTVPLFRYEYLRGKARETITHIQQIESRMLPIQFELDDFAEVTSAIRLPLAELEAELEAVKQRSSDLITQLAALIQAKDAVDETVIALDAAREQCECDWWCFVRIVITSAGVVGIASFLASLVVNPVLGSIIFVSVYLAGLTFSVADFANNLTCDSVGEMTDSFKTVHRGLGQAIGDSQAELVHTLAMRDILIARINSLQAALEAVNRSNASRVLDAKTLDLIQKQYNGIRQSLLTRAQAIAALAQDAFNFERDTELHLIRDAYFDPDRKDYTAAETLQRDLDGLDYMDLTGRTRKMMQLSHAVSLRKHYPISFLALQAAGGARFTTMLREFDRWFPGTHQQRIREIRVEVWIDGKPAPVRGFLSNDGVSMARFQDTGNKRPVDNMHVFPEPDPDIARLCYKRLQRRRHVDTMAFPEFSSRLYEERMRKLQDRERNFFENVGLESTWTIEFLPDQPIDLSALTDVLIHFQYEALFDDNLKRVLEKKRYTDRRETSTFSVKALLAEEGNAADFSGAISFRVPVRRLEAPGIERNIVNVGFIVKPKGAPHLDGPATIGVAYDEAAPVHVVTNDAGVAATAADYPAGTGLDALEAMVHGKSIDRLWSIRITALPGGLNTDAVDDIYLLLNYEYAS